MESKCGFHDTMSGGAPRKFPSPSKICFEASGQLIQEDLRSTPLGPQDSSGKSRFVGKPY